MQHKLLHTKLIGAARDEQVAPVGVAGEAVDGHAPGAPRAPQSALISCTPAVALSQTASSLPAMTHWLAQHQLAVAVHI